MSCMLEFERWLACTAEDKAIQAELKAIIGKPVEIEARFGSMLEFGTAGLRGILGAGLNRMNIYTVRQATQGFANLIVRLGPQAMERGVAIAHDCRHMSREFALEAARVLAASDIVAYVFDELRPTPELSFTVRELHCIAGINITASHNPKEYNGYKAYWEDGAQLPPDHADTVLREIRENDIFSDVYTMPLEKAREKGLIRTIGAEIDEKFLRNVLAQSVGGDAVKSVADSFKIVYTPFHGAGHRLVPETLRRLGFKHILPVPEQMVIDGDFPTVKSPNPEEKEGFSLAIELARREGVDLIIGTDPDADRTGIVVRDDSGEYVSLSGNQVGVLLTDYLISARRQTGRMPENPAVVTTIVSTRMTAEICRRAGVEVFETLTGFKFIGGKIEELEESGSHTCIFAFEESYGYMAGTYARDKDAVVASMLIAEMAAWHRLQGRTLYQALRGLYGTYGHFAERTVSVKIEGYDALPRMAAMMQRLRENAPRALGGTEVTAVRDYLAGTRTVLADGGHAPTGLPKSDVLYFEMADGSSVIVRPSGTEPKVKLYFLVRGASDAETDRTLGRYETALRSLIG